MKFNLSGNEPRVGNNASDSAVRWTDCNVQSTTAAKFKTSKVLTFQQYGYHLRCGEKQAVSNADSFAAWDRS